MDLFDSFNCNWRNRGAHPVRNRALLTTWNNIIPAAQPLRREIAKMKKLRFWLTHISSLLFHHSMLLLTAVTIFTLSGLFLVFVPYSFRFLRSEMAASDHPQFALIRFAIGGTIGLGTILYFLFWRKIR